MRPTTRGPLNPIELTLFQNHIHYAAQQMGWVMTRTAQSPIFSQSHDFSCFVTDRHGQLVTQADGIPIHTGGGGFAVRALLRDFDGDIDPEDAFILSDPYVAGGNHLPDWVIARPVFVEGRLMAFVCNRAHQSDIGGGAAGTYNSAATEIFHEGIRLPVLRLVERGKTRRDLWNLLLLNTRMPDHLDGDLKAMLGSTAVGANLIAARMKEIGVEPSLTALEEILSRGETAMRTALATLLPGEGCGEEGYDDDCFERIDARIRVRITITGEKMVVDFSDTDPQVRGFKNSSVANTHSAVYMAVIAFLGNSVPQNEGAYRCIEIRAPEGTIVNARPPAPVTMCTVFPAQHIIHACWHALAAFDPQRACAGWGMTGNVNTAWMDEQGRTSIMYHWAANAGGGAVRERDGFNQLGNVGTLGALVLPNAEQYEQMFPVRVLKQEFRSDAAGDGARRGGTGVHYAVKIERAGEYTVRAEGTRISRGVGILGGTAGTTSRLLFTPDDRPAFEPPPYAVLRLGPTRLDIWSCSGGGYGDALDRDVEDVMGDVRSGLLSVARAAGIYGVVADHSGLNADWEATDAMRLQRRAVQQLRNGRST